MSSSENAKILGISGKALGGLFSSIARRNFEGQKLIIPWGRPVSGKGLRWKLNESIIGKEELSRITSELLSL